MRQHRSTRLRTSDGGVGSRQLLGNGDDHGAATQPDHAPALSPPAARADCASPPCAGPGNRVRQSFALAVG